MHEFEIFHKYPRFSPKPSISAKPVVFVSKNCALRCIWGRKHQNRCSRWKLTHYNEFIDIRTMEVGSEVEAGQRLKRMTCFYPMSFEPCPASTDSNESYTKRKTSQLSAPRSLNLILLLKRPLKQSLSKTGFRDKFGGRNSKSRLKVQTTTTQ